MRYVLLILFAVLMGAQQVADMLLPWKPYGTYGFSATTFGDVGPVQPDSPAERAGIRRGDRIEIANLSYHQRRRLIYLSASPPGESITLPVVHDGVTRDVTLTSVLYRRTLAENITDILETTARVALLVIAVLLVIKRPSFLTLSFYLFALRSGGGIFVAAFASDATVQAYSLVTNAAMIAGNCASVIFAAMFPRTSPSRTVRGAARALAVIALVWWLIDVASRFYIPFYTSMLTDLRLLSIVYEINVLLPLLLYAIAIIAFVVNYVRSSASDRLRMQWVALGFAIGSLGDFIPPVIRLFGYTMPLWMQNSVLALTIAVPITVAYAILKHHVIDVRFFISRALVYSGITGIAVVTLLLFEIFVAKQLEAYHLDVFLEVAGALAVGLGIHRLHGVVDEFVDRFVFRSFHVAEAHLASIGEATMFAKSAIEIDDLLKYETQRALDLSSVEIVRAPHERDSLSLRLQAARAAIDDGSTFVVPFIIRHRLYGYARFAPHRNGAAIDPNERELLERLAARATVAYDHVTSEERLTENERLRIENDLLRSMVRSGTSP